MKKYIVLIVLFVMVVSSVSLSAQIRGEKPKMENASAFNNALQTYGRNGKEHMRNRIDKDGNTIDEKLTGVNLGISAGMGKDGLSAAFNAEYQFRYFTVGGEASTIQMKMDGMKKSNSTGLSVYAMVDVMSIINVRSNFIFSVGGGVSYNNYSFKRILSYENETEFVDQPVSYKGNPFGPLVRAQVGYKINKNIAFTATVDYRSFSVNGPIGADSKYNTPSGRIGVVVKLGR